MYIKNCRAIKLRNNAFADFVKTKSLFLFLWEFFLLFLAISYVPQRANPSNLILAIIHIAFGIVFVIYAKKELPVSYLIIGAIFDILIPLTSFKNIEIRAMTNAECLCLLAELILYFSFICVDLGTINVRTERILFKKSKISRLEEKIYAFILLIGVLSLLYNSYRNGIAIFKFIHNVNYTESEPFPLYSFFTTLPCLSIFLLVKEGAAKKKKTYIFLILLFISLQLLSGKRWGLFVLAIFLASIIDFRKLSCRSILIIGSLGTLFFLFYTLFRSNNEILTTYRPWLNTESLRLQYKLTELYRYFGMSQRNFSLYFTPENCGPLFQRTGYFFLKFFGFKNNSNLIFVNGYNVCNIIGYMLMDFGNFWFIGLFIWGAAMHLIDALHEKKSSSLLLSILFGFSFLSLTLSFYAYLDSFISFGVVFPIVYFSIRFFCRKVVKK